MPNANKDERTSTPSRRSITGEVTIGIGIGVLAAAFVLFYRSAESESVSPSTVAESAPDFADRFSEDHLLHGEWEQFFWHSEEEGWISGGFYRVSDEEGALRMSIIESQANASDVLRSRALSRVSFDGDIWTFDSRLENGDVIRFKLQHTKRDTFEGYSFYGETIGSPNRWVRRR